MASPFFVPVDLGRTALLLSDVQTQILSRFPPDLQQSYLANIRKLLGFFRSQSLALRRTDRTTNQQDLYDNVPLIVHHTLPFNLNSNAFVSPYNKLAGWVSQLETAGFFKGTSADPNTPTFGVPDSIAPSSGWGSKDEVLLGKLQPNCFASSDLLMYLNARGVRHIILVGLTTMGSILGSARAGADLGFHISLVEEGIMDDDPEVHAFLMNKVLGKFVDIVSIDDVLGLTASGCGK